jgi:RNA polymerase sigma-70 factor (family 1)
LEIISKFFIKPALVMDYRLLEDDILIDRLKSSDEKAFAEIYKRNWFKLYCIAYKQTACRQEAEELVQILFERIWKKRETIIIKNLGAYLAVSLQNTFIDSLRRKKVEKKFQQNHNVPVSANLTEEKFNHSQLLNTVENLLQQLPEKTQSVFRLSRYEEKSVKEIASQLDLTEKAVEYHITKSLKLLKYYLRSYLNSFF